MNESAIALQDFLSAPRVVVEATLEPLIGTRLQPTGFPNLGAAEFIGPSGESSLLVESAQSIANRLEAVTWDDAAGDLVTPLRRLPYVTTSVGGVETDSIREAHRLNSPYLENLRPALAKRAGISILASKKGKKASTTATDGDGDGEESASASVDRRALAKAVFFYDPNTVLHGVFLEKITGLARLTRVLSGFIEAHGIEIVASGGVKNDRIDPSGKGYKSGEKGGAEGGFGNVPYARTEYTAKTITASFAIDTSLIRSYGLGEPAERLLLALALWKISKFLETGLRLRTACDLVVTAGGVRVMRPMNAAIPTIAELETEIRTQGEACDRGGLFASPAITRVSFGE
jgi:CRISPR-associated protein Csb1